MGHCSTLLKRVCCVQYNLSHHPLKVIMTFEWSCGVLLCQNLFPSPLCVCVFVSQKKKRKKKEWVIVPHCLGECVVCNVQYNLPHPPLKVTMAFEWSYSVPLCQNQFPSPFCVFVCVCVCVKPSQQYMLSLWETWSFYQGLSK